MDIKTYYVSTGRITLMGFAMGPMNHVWYTMLDSLLPGKAAAVVVKKILMDQTIAAPFFAFTYFMGDYLHQHFIILYVKSHVQYYSKIVLYIPVLKFIVELIFSGSGTLERQPLDVSWNDFRAKFWDVYKVIV